MAMNFEITRQIQKYLEAQLHIIGIPLIQDEDKNKPAKSLAWGIMRMLAVFTEVDLRRNSSFGVDDE